MKIFTILKIRFNLTIKCSLISKLILIILFVAKIQSFDDLKRIYIGNDNYYIISEKEINFYQNKDNSNKMILMYTFQSSEKITSVDELFRNADVAGGSIPRTPSTISPKLKPIIVL